MDSLFIISHRVLFSSAHTDLQRCPCAQVYQRAVESSNMQDKALRVIHLKVGALSGPLVSFLS